jgi:hypothetical protein
MPSLEIGAASSGKSAAVSPVSPSFILIRQWKPRAFGGSAEATARPFLRVLELLHHRHRPLVEEEPGRLEDTVGGQDPRHLAQVVLGVGLNQVGEDGVGDDQRAGPIPGREGGDGRLALAGVPGLVEDVVVAELEPRRVRREVCLAPLDHPRVQVNPEVAGGPGLDQLAGKAPAAAAEVENGLVGRSGQVGEDRLAVGIVESRGLCRPDVFPHLQRRKRQLGGQTSRPTVRSRRRQ